MGCNVSKMLLHLQGGANGNSSPVCWRHLISESTTNYIHNAFGFRLNSHQLITASFGGSALNDSFVGTLLSCTQWRDPQHFLFQLANTCFCISYLAPNHRYGIVFMHGVLILGFLLFSTWAWNVICAADVFSWNFGFMLLNMAQMVYVLYQMRPVRFAQELDEVYTCLFQPMQVTRQVFKKLVCMEYAQVMSLHAGETYAMQNITRTDRLGLLISGKANVLSDNNLLHHIYSKQFLDSPEFEATHPGSEQKFKVTIVAATPCRYVFWQREVLEYVFAKETFLAHIMSILIARDITTKLYAMNERIVTEKGSHMDIRLPSIAGSLTSYGGVTTANATHDGRSLSWRSSSRTFHSVRSNLPPEQHQQVPLRPEDTPSVPRRTRSSNTDASDSVFDSKEKLVVNHEGEAREATTETQVRLPCLTCISDDPPVLEPADSTTSNEESYTAISETWPVTT